MARVSTVTEPAVKPTRKARARALFDRLPTKWVVTAAAGLAVLSTAAFGGLEDAPADALPQVQAGDTHHGAQLDITPNRAIVVDSLAEQGFEPEPGQVLLVITAEVVNTWHKPVSTLSGVGAADNLRPLDLEEPLGVVLLVDGTPTPWLEPRVPAQLGYIWQVPAGSLEAGETVRVDIYDKVYRADGFVTFGERFQEPFLSAFTELPVEIDAPDGSQ